MFNLHGGPLMPRITPLRMLLLLPTCWLGLVFLWVVLPSPPPSWRSDPAGYLQDGGTITRVYDIADFFPWNDPTPAIQDARADGRSSFAIDYKYHPTTGEIQIGTSFRVNPEYLDLSQPFPALSSPFAARVKTGDQDGIDLPWFTQADATLLFWCIHQDSVYIPLRLRVPDRNTVEVWADSHLWEEHNNRDRGSLASQKVPPFPPLLTINLNIWGSSVGGRRFNVTFPPESRCANSSPSQTFFVRRALSTLIVPVGIFINDYILTYAYHLFVTVLYIAQPLLYLSLICTAVAYACWKSKGSPQFWPWARSFWLTRWAARYLGPSSPLSDDPVRDDVKSSKQLGDFSDDTHGSLQDRSGPRALTCVWDFFASSSPLDDLLFTFGTTRGFVQPLRVPFSRGRRAPQDDESQPAPEKDSSSVESSRVP